MVSPDTIWLRKTELTEDGLFLILRVRSNIRQITVEDADGGSHIEYEYDENEVRYPVPDGVYTVTDLQNLIAAEAANISQKSARDKAWKELNAKPIDELRKTKRQISAAK
ncbi:MAG: hypothetical protein WC359_13725 [Dehalococcoidia bacterium]|jgi:hypothetical protein